jgi:type II secretory ATPase GspE/PulE/Tfp pilus assembly ATPase PilB-like protein
MFFSRKKLDDKTMITMRDAQTARKIVASSVPVGKTQQAKETVISDVKDIPSGAYLPFRSINIPRDFQKNFAVIVASRDTIHVLVAEMAFKSHDRFEFARRLTGAGYAKQIIKIATLDVIQSVHENNRSSTEGATEAAEDTDIEKKAWSIIDRAIEMGASDIHIETRSTHARVFFRIHGERVEMENLSMANAIQMCTVLYNVHADSDNKGTEWNPKTIQDTSIMYTTSNGLLAQLRFSSAPIHPSDNVHAVIRVLVMDEAAAKPLEDIGYTQDMVEAIEEMITGAQGMVVVAGPTNSGKSTSMQALVQRIQVNRGATIKVITVEDPVEYIIPNACQMGVPQRDNLKDKASGSAYPTFLKGSLRQDPDVLMIGEIRNAESAETVKNMVLAGRKVLTTLHVFEAFAIFARLREIGIPESVLFMQNFISGVIYQRLVRVLCRDCSIPIGKAMEMGMVRKPLFDRVCRVASLEEHDVRVRNPVGCEHCKHTGVTGRTVCSEILIPDLKMLTLLSQKNEIEARKYWQSNQRLFIHGLGVSAVAHAITKMRLGMLDPNDIESQIGFLSVEIDSNDSTGFEHGSYSGGGYSGGGRWMSDHASDYLPPSLRKVK